MPIGTPVPDECLIGRYTGEARFINKGDPELCAAWAGFARGVMGGLLNKLANGGITVGGRHIAMPDGTRISVRYDGAQHIIKIDTQRVVKPEGNLCPIQIESGLAQFDELPLYLPEADPPIDDRPIMEPFKLKRAASDNYDPPLTAKVKNQLGLLTKPMPDSNAESVVLGRPLRDIYENADEKTKEEHKSEIDEEGRKLYSLAKTCGIMSPSMYSGKMQLYIESIWGYKKASDRIIAVDPIESGILAPPYYIIDGNELQFTYRRGSQGLFVTEDYKHYFIITLKGGAVNVRYLRVKNYCSTILQRYLGVKGGTLSKQSISKLEAIILSTTEPDIVYTIEQEYVAVGSPIGDYGWHFNHDGHTANIVLHEEDYTGDPPVLVGFISRSYEIRFTFNESWIDDKTVPPLAFSCSLLRTDPYQLSHQDRIYWYDYSFRTTRINMVWTYQLSGQDIPFYCFYDTDDVLVTIFYFVEIEYGDPGVPNPYQCFVVCPDGDGEPVPGDPTPDLRRIAPPDCNWFDRKQPFGNSQYSGFYPDNYPGGPEAFLLRGSVGLVQTSNTHWVDYIKRPMEFPSTPCIIEECFTSGWWSSQPGSICGSDPRSRFLTFGDPAVHVWEEFGIRRWWWALGVYDKVLQDSFLAIPLFDCETIYMGDRTLYGGYYGEGVQIQGGVHFRSTTIACICPIVLNPGDLESYYMGGANPIITKPVYTQGGYGMDISRDYTYTRKENVYAVTKNSDTIEINIQDGNDTFVSYFEQNVFGNSREYPYIDWFLLYGERGYQDYEIVYINKDGDLDMSKTKYQDNAPHSGNYIGWA